MQKMMGKIWDEIVENSVDFVDNMVFCRKKRASLVGFFVKIG